MIPLEILRKIEEKYESDAAKLDSSFGAFSQCAGKGQNPLSSKTKGVKTYVLNKVNPDPCVTAAEQYQCGLSKDKAFTTELILQRQGSIQVIINLSSA